MNHYLKLYPVLICLSFLVAGFGAFAQDNNKDAFAFEQNQRLGRGVNILGYDPIWKDSTKARMKSAHFKLLKEAGFDNVRIKISPFRFSLNDEDFTIDPVFFITLDWAIEQALSNKLMVIVDFHEHGAMGNDPLGTRPMFLSMWKQIAEHCKEYPDEVLFEVANEPNMKPEIWNALHAEAYEIIRKSNPDRTLIIGTINGNQIKHLIDLTLPKEDRNIIVAIHYYSPIQFTHQGAPWSKNNKDLSGITWTSLESETQAVKDDFNFAQNWSKTYSRPLTLGEFGAYEKADMPSRIRWTDFVAREAEARGWSWSYWQFDSDFILYSMDKDEWIPEIKGALIPNSSTFVRTVNGPVTGDRLGFTLTHEHLFSNFGIDPGQAHQYDESGLYKQVIPYLKSVRSLGVTTIFDCTTAYFGRRADLLKRLSDSTGIQIVTNTGFYGAANDKYLPEFAIGASAEELAEVWIAEVENGISGTGIRPGFIKLAFDSGNPSTLDLKLFEAGVLAHLETGLTLAVHTGANTKAIQAQLGILKKYQVSPEALVWVHASEVADIDLLIEKAKEGVWISLDGFKSSSRSKYIHMLKAFDQANLIHKVLLSHDGNSYPAGGAIRPYDAILSDLLPAMREAGFSEDKISRIMIQNPREAFSIQIKQSQLK